MKNNNDKVKNEDELGDAESIDVSDEELVDVDASEVEELKEKVTLAQNQYKRALADYQNLQKRVQDEKQDWVRAANKELLLRLLPVLDTLILANKHDASEGLKVSINQFLDALKAEGIVKIETKDMEFDPHLMDCMVTAQGEENKVLEEARPGYMIYDKVLRPAQVIVGKKE